MCTVCSAPSEEAILISPTVIVRAAPESIGVVTVGKGPDEALLVFRGPEDARAYQEAFGKQDRADGFEIVGMPLEAVEALLERHGLSRVAMPEPWTGTGRADLFSAENFLRLLGDTEASGDRPARQTEGEASMCEGAASGTASSGRRAPRCPLTGAPRAT